MHRDRCIVVAGHPSLPVGVVFVPLRVWFGMAHRMKGLFKEPKDVCSLGLWAGHGLQCGGLGGAVGDCGLVEDVDTGVGFRRCWLLGIGGRGCGPSPARPPSGVEGVDATLRCGRPAAPILGLWQGPCVVDFAPVLGAVEVLCVAGARLYGDHLTTTLISRKFGGSPQLIVVGGVWIPFDVDLESLVVPRDAVPMGDLTRGPYAHGSATGPGVFEGHLYFGTYCVPGV